ncbi:hypothetical protein KP509_22G014800 [Ceratopteris richardii]|uniref:Pentatricopeptide repeat-containing protein n=1 Tax=Ceratopteris richardii TaxID=49495 RepID=A0A8T2S2T4_CERRI|nr:hypothetical protein KP509_22G014800 [Ceratopteris richardii]
MPSIPSCRTLARICVCHKKEVTLSQTVDRLHKDLWKHGFKPEKLIQYYAVVMVDGLEDNFNVQQVFQQLYSVDECSIDGLIRALIKSGKTLHAVSLYTVTQDFPVELSAHTLVALIKVCSSLRNFNEGARLHGEMARKGMLKQDLFACNSLIHMYGKWGWLMHAQEVFADLTHQDVVSWTALIAGYVAHGHSEKGLFYFEQMQIQGVSPTSFTYACALKACGCCGDWQKGREIHGEIERKGLLKSDHIVGNALVDMYVKLGQLADVEDAFDRLQSRDVVSWTVLISGYVKFDLGMKALNCFEHMQAEGVIPNAHTYASILKACAISKAVHKGQHIHEEINKRNLLENPVVGCALVDMYANFGLLTKAQDVHHKLVKRDVVTWNSLITGFARHELAQDAIECFDRMQIDGVSPNAITYVSVLNACSSLKAIVKGIEVHQEVLKHASLKDDFIVGSAVVDMYAKCGWLVKAQEVFDGLAVHDVIVWNALIAGYTDNGYGEKALDCFDKMQIDGVVADAATYISGLNSCGNIKAPARGADMHAEVARKGLLNKEIMVGYAAEECGVEALICFEQMHVECIFPNAITYACILKACGSIGALEMGQEVHKKVVEQGLLELNVVIGSALVDMYAKCGWLGKAQEIFDDLEKRDVVTWNSLVTGYANLEDGKRALQIYDRMKQEGVSPNAVTFIGSLKACGTIKDCSKGQSIHADIDREGISGCVHTVNNALVDMYSKCGYLDNAREIFDSLLVRDVVAWNALIAGYVNNEKSEEALKLYDKMQKEGVAPDALTFSICLKACIGLGAIEKGVDLHAHIVRNKVLKEDLIIGNALVEFYVKCGLLSQSQEVFDKLLSRDVVSWNTLMSGYIQSGDYNKVFILCERMTEVGEKPDLATFLIVLNACNHAGLMDKCEAFFDIMTKDYGLRPSLEHYTCIVDLLARSGQLVQAISMIERMKIVPDIVVWHAALDACEKWGNVKLGKIAFEHAISLDEKDSTAYLCMCNIYANAGMLEDVYNIKARQMENGAA